MNLKYGIFYNVQFDTLLVTLNSDDKNLKTEQINDVIILKSNDLIVGFNILNVSKEIALKPGMISENIQAVNFVENKLKDIYPLKQNSQFVIAEILEMHPIEGTHLNACKIKNNEGVVDVVTGAKNAYPGMITVMATNGTWLPNGNVITAGMMRGFPTVGMLCSAKELNLDGHKFNVDGVLDLGSTFQDQVGKSFWGVYETN
ncbi:hypothetical protein ELUMI_v1c03280 [Williamsoniiplasma luminosum]|uniref:tRNA-binding domain-containing protein n=1 Tax=Williamsoniiplasma luminosum TaxID=214888 RepID=A0A2K8NWQ3_9MOLU|nr:hypothetical protein [Williamsoniiplasma luminosum]ATZ17053.1 hypothetical protein ELUMI_v1c03280 [Williamsoniiplasma luminosum]